MGVPYAEVIGDPIAQSKSPLIHGFWLRQLGIEAEYRATRVTHDELPAYLASRRVDPDWCGCNVTMPLKQAILPLLDECVGAAAMIDAVNTVTRTGGAASRLIGHNTDVAGFLEPLGEWPEPDKIYRTATVIGTGGAAAAVCWGLKKRGFLLINLARTLKNGLLFQKLHGGDDPDFVQALAAYADPPPREPWLYENLENANAAVLADLLVNASPLGMTGQPPLLFDLANIRPAAIVYDLVTQPAETDLLLRARAAGHRVIGGLEMLVGQAAEAFGLIFGLEAPREHDAELRALLTS
jgi:shikimate dehydrogenase